MCVVSDHPTSDALSHTHQSYSRHLSSPTIAVFVLCRSHGVCKEDLCMVVLALVSCLVSKLELRLIVIPLVSYAKLHSTMHPPPLHTPLLVDTRLLSYCLPLLDFLSFLSLSCLFCLQPCFVCSQSCSSLCWHGRGMSSSLHCAGTHQVIHLISSLYECVRLTATVCFLLPVYQHFLVWNSDFLSFCSSLSLSGIRVLRLVSIVG